MPEWRVPLSRTPRTSRGNNGACTRDHSAARVEPPWGSIIRILISCAARRRRTLASFVPRTGSSLPPSSTSLATLSGSNNRPARARRRVGLRVCAQGNQLHVWLHSAHEQKDVHVRCGEHLPDFSPLLLRETSTMRSSLSASFSLSPAILPDLKNPNEKNSTDNGMQAA